MTGLSITIDGVEFALDRIRARATGDQGIAGLSSSANGQGAQGGIVVDDPDGTAAIRGWMQVIAEDDRCTDAPRLFTGYVADHTERRGKYRIPDTGREIDTTVNDLNSLLSCRLIVNSDGNRPRETEAARFAWLFASPYLNGLVEDLGEVNASAIFYCDAADYRDKYAADVIAEMASTRGLIFFVRWYQDAEAIGLFFDDPTATTYTSTLTISNDLADVGPIDDPGTTCFLPYLDGEQKISPEDVVSRIKFNYKGGYVVRNNLTTAATYFSVSEDPPITTRGLSVTDERVGSLTTATTFADRLLARYSVEKSTITCTLRLPAEKVGLIDAGMRISVKFTHLTGFDDFAWTRVEERTIVQTEGRRDYYDMALTLSTYGLSIGVGTGGGSTDPFPHPPSGTTAPLRVWQEQVSPASEDGRLILLWLTKRAANTGTVTPPAGFTSLTSKLTGGLVFGAEDGIGQLFYRIADDEATNYPSLSDPLAAQYLTLGSTGYNSVFIEFEVGTTVDNISTQELLDATPSGNNWDTGLVTPSRAATIVGFVGAPSFFAHDVVFTPGTGVTQLWATDAAPECEIFAGWENATGPDSINGHGCGRYFSATVALTTAEAIPPAPGQWVPWTTVTMAGAVGTTAFPYSPLSLQVKVDGLLISPASYTETDPAAGTFTLSWVPDADEVVTVTYQGI